MKKREKQASITFQVDLDVNNVPEKIRVFPSPQTVSLTVIGGINQISNLNPNDIKVIVDFNNWSHLKQFYEPKVSIPKNILDWRDISPKNVEIGVAREIK